MYELRHIYTTGTNRLHIWGVFVIYSSDGDYYGTERYIFWGSPKKPQIRRFYVGNAYRNHELGDRIREKDKSNRHTKIKISEMPVLFPDTLSEIGQFVTVKKLKNVGN